MATEATLTKIDRLALDAWTKIDAGEGSEAAEELRGIANDLLAACVAAIEATGGSQHWNGWTRHFLILAENALRKAGIDPAMIEAKDTVGPEDAA